MLGCSVSWTMAVSTVSELAVHPHVALKPCLPSQIWQDLSAPLTSVLGCTSHTPDQRLFAWKMSTSRSSYTRPKLAENGSSGRSDSSTELEGWTTESRSVFILCSVASTLYWVSCLFLTNSKCQNMLKIPAHGQHALAASSR